MKKFFIWIIVILFIFSVITLSQKCYSNKADTDDISKKIDIVVNKAIEKNRIPGIAVSAVKDGEIIYSKGFEKSDGFNDREITADTPLFIGSISKSFTSLAIMQLVEEGKLNLDDPINKYLDFFEVDKGSYNGEITLRHLLHHKSGMSEKEYMAFLDGDLSIEEGVKDLMGMKLGYGPGEEFNYFNPNYNILGLIIETVSDMSYEDYIRKNILTPLEMNNTYLSKEIVEEKVPTGHLAFFSFPLKKEGKFEKHSLPSGYIVSTANDMAKYLIFQQTGEYKGRKLLSEGNIKEMQSPDNNKEFGYAMGWNIGEKFGYKIIEHGGSLYTYSANMAMIPEKNIGVILLINQNHFVYNIISNNQLVDNILKVLINPGLNTAEINFIPLGAIFLILAIIAILTIVKDLYHLFNLKKWKKKMKNKSKLSLYINISLDFIIPLFLIFGIPLVFINIFNRGFAFLPAFYLMPGIVSWVLISSSLSLIKGILKICKYNLK
ncbi:MAG: serine hydrolase domain-containing protein [Bacillota bacterium]